MKNNEIKIGDALKQFVQTKSVQKGYRQKEIEMFWQKEMGVMINKYTTRIKLVRETLFITISSSPLRQELMMERHKIKNLINASFDDSYIEDIVIQ